MSDYEYPPHLIRPTRWLILVYIEEYFRAHHTMPATRQIARAFGIGSADVPNALKVESTLDYVYPAELIKPTRWLILTYIREFRQAHHRYPRVRDIARSFGIPSQHVYAYLRKHLYLQQVKTQRKERVS